VEDIDWDYTAQFLGSAGAGGTVVHQYSKASKEWSEVLRDGEGSNGVVWGGKARSLVVGLKGSGEVRVWGSG
jgi:pre-mRNA-processing factor 19